MLKLSIRRRKHYYVRGRIGAEEINVSLRLTVDIEDREKAVAHRAIADAALQDMRRMVMLHGPKVINLLTVQKGGRLHWAIEMPAHKTETVGTFAEAARQYLAQRRDAPFHNNHILKVRQLVRLIGDIPVSTISSDPEEFDFSIWRPRVESQTKMGANTRNVMAVVIRAVINYCARRGMCHAVRWSIPGAGNNETNLLQSNDIEPFMELCRTKYPAIYPTCRMALETGMRRGELWRAQWQDVKRSQKGRRFLEVWSIKGKTQKKRFRHLPLRPDLWVVLTEAKTNDVYILAQPNGTPFHTITGSMRELFETQFNAVRDEYFGRESRDSFTMNGFRHTYATQRANQGMDSFRLMRLMGHTNLATTSRYYGDDLDSEWWDEFDT